MKLSRRRFLGVSVGAVGAALAASTAYLNINNEADQPVIDEVLIPVNNLPPALEGFTIAVMSDFHLYPFTQIDLIERAVAMANSLKPDLAVLLGDYVWHDVEAIFDLTPIFARLDARYGVFSIVGNHDIWTDINVVKAGFAENKLPLLVNEGLAIQAGTATLYLAALDDGWSGQPDLTAAMDGAPPGVPVVLLLHEPDLADTYAQDGRIALQLSGHSHGGQIRLPGVGAIITPYLSWKYDLGLYKVNDMWLYTNRGLGVTNEPIRYNCPPEITKVILMRS